MGEQIEPVLSVPFESDVHQIRGWKKIIAYVSIIADWPTNEPSPEPSTPHAVYQDVDGMRTVDGLHLVTDAAGNPIHPNQATIGDYISPVVCDDGEET